MKNFNLNILKKNKSVLFAISLLTFSSFTGIVNAEEIVITGNGSSSTNEVVNSSNSNTNVEQNNNMDVNNDVNVTSNTGDNSASNNTGGDVGIQTGDTNTAVQINNSGNASDVTTGCCASGGGSTTISDNGAGSENTANTQNVSNTNISVTNNATITNTIRGYANTGNNTADDNTYGNVSIKTGDIYVNEYINNGPINVSTIKAAGGDANGNYNFLIKGNGSFSDNKLFFQNTNDIDVDVENNADILNDTLWVLNTGKNSADDNTNGDVDIFTGSISYISEIINGPINVSQVDISCCEKEIEEEKEQPTGGVEPKTTPPPTKEEPKPSESKPSDGKGGEVLSEAVNKILPATGNYTFFFLLLGSSALFLLGLILRLQSGNAPGVSVSSL